MAKTYEITVFEHDFDNMEYEGGYWVTVLSTTSYEEAEKALIEYLEKFGWDDVEWDWDSDSAWDYYPEDDEPSWDEEEGFDPYSGSYSWDC